MGGVRWGLEKHRGRRGHRQARFLALGGALGPSGPELPLHGLSGVGDGLARLFGGRGQTEMFRLRNRGRGLGAGELPLGCRGRSRCPRRGGGPLGRWHL
jgi:hypothetical protein